MTVFTIPDCLAALIFAVFFLLSRFIVKFGIAVLLTSVIGYALTVTYIFSAFGTGCGLIFGILCVLCGFVSKVGIVRSGKVLFFCFAFFAVISPLFPGNAKNGTELVYFISPLAAITAFYISEKLAKATAFYIIAAFLLWEISAYYGGICFEICEYTALFFICAAFAHTFYSALGLHNN